MEFYFETLYDQEALTAMAKALRKVMRRKNNIFSKIFGTVAVILGLLLSTPLGIGEWSFSVKSMISYAAILIIAFTLLFEDTVNGHFAKKRMLPGTAETESVFTDEEYVTTNNAGKTHWNYARIKHLAETRNYFVFIFNENHAQIYDKEFLTGGTEEEFRQFIEEKTDLKFKRV